MNEQRFDFQDQFQGSGSLPDTNTAEAILYGSAYTWIKNALWTWDEFEDYLLRKAEDLDSQIMDREWAYDVILHNPYLIRARSPPVNDVNKLKDLLTLANLEKVLKAIEGIKNFRRQNQAWARMKGVSEYVQSLYGRGVTESEWKAATASYNTEPINYDYVHGLTPSMLPGEVTDWSEAMRVLIGEKEYDNLLNKLNDAAEDTSEEESADYEDYEAPDEDVCQIVVTKDELKIMFDNPVKELIEILSAEQDECTAAAEYWCLLDIDNRYIIDTLINYAREM